MYVVGTPQVRIADVPVTSAGDAALDGGRKIQLVGSFVDALRPATHAAAGRQRRQRARPSGAAFEHGRCAGRRLQTQVAERNRRRRVADSHDLRKSDALAAGCRRRVVGLPVYENLRRTAVAAADHWTTASPSLSAVDETAHVLHTAVVMAVDGQYRLGGGHRVARVRTIVGSSQHRDSEAVTRWTRTRLFGVRRLGGSACRRVACTRSVDVFRRPLRPSRLVPVRCVRLELGLCGGGLGLAAVR